MTDLTDLYQELILDHTKRPRNFGVLADANREAEGDNPLCGDHVTVFVELDGDSIRDIHFEGSGCAISTASASLMTEAVKGKSVEHARALFEKLHKLVTGASGPNGEGPELGKLAALAGVREYPVRVKCATLPWHTLSAALRGDEEPVTTE
jgi:nitrogen fixation NifU-like protein